MVTFFLVMLFYLVGVFLHHLVYWYVRRPKLLPDNLPYNMVNRFWRDYFVNLFSFVVWVPYLVLLFLRRVL